MNQDEGTPLDHGGVQGEIETFRGCPVAQRGTHQRRIEGLRFDLGIVEPTRKAAGTAGGLGRWAVEVLTPACESDLLGQAQAHDSPGQDHQTADVPPSGAGQVLQKGTHQGTEHLLALGWTISHGDLHGDLQDLVLGASIPQFCHFGYTIIKFVSQSVTRLQFP